eukprot:9362971-Alexandrium_andersonii.AAC.1
MLHCELQGVAPATRQGQFVFAPGPSKLARALANGALVVRHAGQDVSQSNACLLYTSPSPRD